MTNTDQLKAWCLGLGIHPNVIDRDDMKRNIELQDGLGAYEILRREARPFIERIPMVGLDEGYQLEFMSIVQGNPLGGFVRSSNERTIKMTPEPSKTPLLDAILAEGHIADSVNMSAVDVETYLREHNTHRAAYDANRMCTWEPCTYILFGQGGESHADYHIRKGRC
jgi:hypothetical protein